MKVVDSHCHIDGERYDSDRPEVIARAAEAGVVAMLNVGTGSPLGSSFEDTVAMAEGNPQVYAAVGIHPHDASEYTEEAEKRLVSLSENPKVIAWGEIGLDFYYDHSPRQVQKDVFVRQLAVARELDLPVIIHSRSADQETLRILLRECSEPGFRGGIMHCFGGTPDMALRLMDTGFLISFAGNVTFKNASELRAAAREVPLTKLLVETDSPFLTPVPHRGKRNEPVRVIDTLRFLADFYEMSAEDLALQTTRNFVRFFRLEKDIHVA